MGHKQKLILASFLSLLLVSACDRGGDQVWEFVEYNDPTQSDSRTAGKQFKWVLVSMASRKGTVLEPLTEEGAIIVKADTMPPMLDERPIPRAIKISKHIPLDYDEVQFATAIPRKDFLSHSDIEMKALAPPPSVMPLEDMSVPEVVEVVAETKAEVEAVEIPTAPVQQENVKIKDADSLFRGLTLAK